MSIFLFFRAVGMLLSDEIFFVRYSWGVYRGRRGICPWWELYTGTIFIDLMLFVWIVTHGTIVLSLLWAASYLWVPISYWLVLQLGVGIPMGIYLCWLLFWSLSDFHITFLKVKRNEAWQKTPF